MEGYFGGTTSSTVDVFLLNLFQHRKVLNGNFFELQFFFLLKCGSVGPGE
jgi:hypothetical protein